jgi:alpha-tubulin suppressor-like RCC1 family protein
MPGAPANAAGDEAPKTTTSTSVVGWGRNTAGQVGDNTWTNRSTPSRTCAVAATDCATSPLTSVAAIKGGGVHTVALRADGSVLSWGANFDGQLGDGTTTSRYTPVPVCAVGATDCAATPLTGVTAIAAGWDHNLALLSDGTVVSWGRNYSGRLGDGTYTDRTTPVRVCAVGATDCAANPLNGVVAIAAGSLHSLALLGDGTVVAWGDNWNGQLGDGTSTGRHTPGPVCAVGTVDCAATPLTGVTAITSGSGYNLARLNTGAVVGWGFNGSGQLGDGTTTTRTTPVSVCAVGATDCTTAPLTGVTSLAASPSGAHSFALTANGQVLSWGFNGNGELGNGTTADRSTPGAVCAIAAVNCAATPLSGITSVVAGGQAGAALGAGGAVVTWGGNYDGQLGNSSTATKSTAPVRVCAPGATNCSANPLTNVTTLGAGRWHFLAARG